MENINILYIILCILSILLCILSIINAGKAKEFYRKTLEQKEDMIKTLKEYEIDEISSTLIEKFKEIPRYHELSGKHEWYLFNLQSVAFYIRDNKDNPEVFKDFDIFDVMESIAIAWCKISDSVFKDFIIISEYYNPKEKKEEKEEEK